MNNTEELTDSGLLYDPYIDTLLSEFSKSRSELSAYMSEVDIIRQQVGDIFPSTTDFRNKFVLEEKIKAMASFFSMLLNIRQEFNKSIKDEIDIRRKLFSNIKDDGLESLDMRKLAGLVEDEMKSKS